MDYFGAIKELYPNITRDDLELRDDGQGTYIYRWSYSEGAQPDLTTLTSRAIELSSITQVKRVREAQYPPIGDQLDAILKYLQLQQNLPADINNIVLKWQVVKAANPLPSK